MFARFVRLDFRTHYGNEYYCPISLIKVHGKTMMDDFEESKKKNKKNKQGNLGSRQQRAEGGDQEHGLEAKSQPSLMNMTLPNAIPKLLPPTMNSIPDSISLSLPPAAAPHDPWQAFRQSCPLPAPPVTEQPVVVEEADDDDQNIFKAIYERLDRLEANTTYTHNTLQAELKSLTELVRVLSQELGTVEQGNRLDLYRHKLRIHLYQRLDERWHQTERSLQATLLSMQRTDRRLLLLVLGMSLLVAVTCWLGWRSSQRPHSLPLAVRSSGPSTPLARSYTPSQTAAVAGDQQVPPFEAIPLLLGDQEADYLVDAQYVGTPSMRTATHSTDLIGDSLSRSDSNEFQSQDMQSHGTRSDEFQSNDLSK